MHKHLLPWLSVSTLWLSACDRPTAAPEAPAAGPPIEEANLTREQLGNLSYPSDFGPGGRVQLQNGVFEAAEPEDPTSHVVVRLTDYMAEGDLNGDGRKDVAVILESTSGGSGSFMDLAAVLNTPEGPKPVAVTDLGDRTDVRKMALEDGKVAIELVAHGPNDPVCCPTQLQRREYRLAGQQWVANDERAP